MTAPQQPAYRDPDPFQLIWQNPSSKRVLYLDAENGFLVMPDENPVVPHHVLVIARDPVPYEELSQARRHAMQELADCTYEFMRGVLQPQRKITVARWGNLVRTAHLHLVPRNKKQDALHWAPMSLSEVAKQAQLDETQRLLTFPPAVAAQAATRVADVLRRFADGA